MYVYSQGCFLYQQITMVRRTKADAEATRTALLDAAEQLFQANGVSRTSLQDIASAAGTTRGAIYWHFKDKADLFNAMMDRVTLPLEQSTYAAQVEETPLQQMRMSVLTALHKTATDEQARRVFEIATQQVEYNGEMLAVRERQYILAAQALGFSTRRIVFRHALPNLLRASLVFSMADIVLNILTLAALSYLGLGVQPPTPEWGAIVAEGQGYLRSAWWISTFSGLTIVLTGVGFSLIGDGIADRLGSDFRLSA